MKQVIQSAVIRKSSTFSFYSNASLQTFHFETQDQYSCTTNALPVYLFKSVEKGGITMYNILHSDPH